MSQSNVEQELVRQAQNLLVRLGYSVDEQEPGMLREAREVLGQVFNRAHLAGYRQGHKHGWEDRGRDPGREDLPRRQYQPPQE